VGLAVGGHPAAVSLAAAAAPGKGGNDQGYAVVSMGWTVDHLRHNQAKARGECKGGKSCKHRCCCELAHLKAKPHGENLEQRGNPGDA
jgi:hypothetical protein